MKTIDLEKVPENPSAFSDLMARSDVAAAMKLEDEVDFIEADLGNTLIVEMSNGMWLNIPKEALITK